MPSAPYSHVRWALSMQIAKLPVAPATNSRRREASCFRFAVRPSVRCPFAWRHISLLPWFVWNDFNETCRHCSSCWTCFQGDSQRSRSLWDRVHFCDGSIHFDGVASRLTFIWLFQLPCPVRSFQMTVFFQIRLDFVWFSHWLRLFQHQIESCKGRPLCSWKVNANASRNEEKVDSRIHNANILSTNTATLAASPETSGVPRSRVLYTSR